MPPKRVRSKSPGPAKGSPGKKGRAGRSKSPGASKSKSSSRAKSPAPVASGGRRSSRPHTPVLRYRDSEFEEAGVLLRFGTSEERNAKDIGRRRSGERTSGSPAKKILKRSISFEEAMEAKELTELRKSITLFRSPFKTLFLFAKNVSRTCMMPVKWAADPANISFVIPSVLLLAGLVVAHFTDGPHSATFSKAEHLGKHVLWWFGLGVASSIGLGTGAHTGSLFLFPHICAVVRTAEEVNNLNFDHSHDMWSLPPPKLADSFTNTIPTPDATPPSFWDIYSVVLFTIVVWGTGTALGELPPYLVSYSAAKAGKEDEEYQQLMGEISEEGDGAWDFLKKMERWMVGFLREHGFWGVLLMASYPNALFDMCGLCCGHFMMPMGSFLLATTIGKGFIKAPMQGLVFTWVFRKSGRHEFLNLFSSLLDFFTLYVGVGIGVALVAVTVALRRIPSMRLLPVITALSAFLVVGLTFAAELQHIFGITEKVEKGLDKVLGFCSKTATTEADAPQGLGAYLNPKAVFGYLVMSLIIYFIIDVITKLAQQEQSDKDRAYIQKKYRGSD